LARRSIVVDVGDFFEYVSNKTEDYARNLTSISLLFDVGDLDLMFQYRTHTIGHEIYTVELIESEDRY